MHVGRRVAVPIPSSATAASASAAGVVVTFRVADREECRTRPTDPRIDA